MKLWAALVPLMVLGGCGDDGGAPTVDAGTTPTTESGTTCTTAQPGTQCVFCSGDTFALKECRDGAWVCPAGSRERCEAKCTGEGPICCGSGDTGPTEPSCTGMNTWQCPIGTIAKPRTPGC